MNSQVLTAGLIQEERYPLSALQQGMLYHHLAAADLGVDVEQLVLALHERIDEGLFRRAWEIVTTRHAVLRTTFRWEGGGEPEQVVCSGVHLPWQVHDCQHVAQGARMTHYQSFLAQDRRHGVALDRAPLWRLALLRWHADDCTVVWTFHHAALDGRSFVMVLREVFSLYDAARQGTPAVLPAPAPYGAYLQWLGRQDFSHSEGFWRSVLQGVCAPTPLPEDPAGVPDQEARKEDLAVALSTQLTDRLRAFSGAHEITLNTLMQAAWALLLSRHSGETEVVFGATRACRSAGVKGLESMVGLFINTLPVRASVRPEAMVTDWLRELRMQWVDMRSHEHSPLVKVQGCSDVPRERPLFESLVVFERYALSEALRTSGRSWAHGDVSLFEKTNFPLTFSVHDGDRLHLQIGYRTDRYTAAGAARLMGHLLTLLDSIIDPRSKRLGDLQMLTAAERMQILVEWNATERNYTGKRCIHELVERQAQRTPQRIALSFGDCICTYGQLNAKANQVAQVLRRFGIGAGSFVPLLFDAGIDLVIAELAVMKAGAAFVPLDRRWPASRIRSVLDDLTSPLLLAGRDARATAAALVIPVITVDRDELAGLDANPAVGAQLTDPIYLLFTSGSTGKPKGAINQHCGVVNRFFNMNDRFGCGEQDVILATTAPVFDSSVWQYFWPLTAGGRVVIPDSQASADPQHLLDLIALHKVTITDFVPALLAAITEQMDEDPSARARWGTLRHVLVGGEAIIPEVVYRFKAHLPATSITNAYGPTETSIGVVFYELPAQPVSAIPIGRPLRNVHALILDTSLNPVPVGVPGDLYIGGVCVGLGYLNNELATRQVFIPNPFPELKGSTLYRTGDRARFLPDGNIAFLGRTDAQVKIRGFRIELGDVETALRDCPGVRECVVVAREEGSGAKHLVAYLTVALRQSAPTSAKLKECLGQKLPSYMIPVVFVVMDRLPQTPSGKVDRKSLPVPDLGLAVDQNQYVAPSTPTEIRLAGIWCEVLRLEKVGVHDSFFDLGGHSLLAVKLVARIDRSLQLSVTVPALFRNPTICSLAAFLDQRNVGDPESGLLPLIAFQTHGSRPPLFFLHGDWTGGGYYCERLSRQLGDDQPFYALHPYRAGREDVLTLQETVDFHLTVIREQTPRGPYVLGGYCIGATVAVEIARRLIEQGEEVRHLLLLDPPQHVITFPRRFWHLVDKWGDYSQWNLLRKIHFFENCHDGFLNLLALSRRWLEMSRHWLQMPWGEKIRAALRHLGLMRARGTDPAGAWDGDADAGHWTLCDGLDFKLYCLASYLHILKPVTVPATVYFPEESPPSWLSHGTVAGQTSSIATVETVPGNHYTCITTHAAVLADRMQKTLSALGPACHNKGNQNEASRR